MILDVKNVTKSYVFRDQQLPVLKGVNLTIDKPQTIAILGQSGSGKSTLLSLLAALDKPDQGEINFDHQNLKNLTEDELTKLRSKNIGVIFQHFYLVPYLTALENVMLPLEILKADDIQVKAKSVLESVGLGSRIDHYPHELSGGEAQRVAIARAFIASPKMILADEPSGNLDAKTGSEVMSLLFKLARDHQITLILVTHNPDLSHQCDRIFNLESGILNEVNS
jgi:putative ABC transport system ATP-binding protein